MKRSRVNVAFRIAEFLTAGILVGLLEHHLILNATTGHGLRTEHLGVAVLIIIPFAVLTEFVVDHPRFWHRLFRIAGHKFDDMEDLFR